MGLFRRRRRTPPGSPPDPVLLPLSVVEAAHLVALAEQAASTRGLAARYDGDGALVTDDGLVAGLTNLARTVSAHRRRHWAGIVAAHFDQLGRAFKESGESKADDIASRLYLRLVSTDGLPAWPDRPQEFVPGVQCVPATASDRAVSMHLDTERLGLDPADATRIGLANLRRLTDEIEYRHHECAEVAAISGTIFTASRALVLDTVLRETMRIENPSYGALVAFPVRDLRARPRAP